MTDLSQAVSILRNGGLVAFPTETVYGLGADARNEHAVQRVFAVKQRPANHPLIVHLADAQQMSAWAQEIPDAAWQLAKHFWPGPLTLVLRKQPQVLAVVTGGQETVALRVPAHPIAQALLQAFGDGLVAPSANQFTHLSPTTAEAVYAELGEQVDVILDGGLCEVGVESTILDLTESRVPRILRPGMITRLQIAHVLRQEVFTKEQMATDILAPGMHPVHYAPRTKTMLLAPEKLLGFLHALLADDLPCAVLTRHAEPFAVSGVEQIIMARDAAGYAHELYDALRTVDDARFKYIIVEDVPRTAEWEAIRDRLQKASRNR